MENHIESLALTSKPPPSRERDRSLKERRVAMGRPGVLLPPDGRETFSIPCVILELGRRSCRLAVSPSTLPSDWRWLPGDTYLFRMDLQAGERGDIARIQLLWAQNLRSDLDLLGVSFVSMEEKVERKIERLIAQRLRGGVEVPSLPFSQNPDAKIEMLIPLVTPLRMEGWDSTTPPSLPYRFSLLRLNRWRLEARLLPATPSSPSLPLSTTSLRLSVYPPAWSGVEKRALHFLAPVVEQKGDLVTFALDADQAEICLMILAMIPPKIERKAKPIEVDIRIVITILFVMVVLLYILWQMEL